jgi:Raf kinase inhibitor-like YbhB/YbcL family protein
LILLNPIWNDLGSMSTKLTASLVSILLLITMTLSACTSDNKPTMQESVSDMTIKFTSSAFSEGETIPKKFTCDGDNVSPPLSWSDLPEGTMSLALIMDDQDAPAGTWVHWVLYNIPADQNGLIEGVRGAGIEGKNTSGKQSYGGPCPPRGPAHRYFFKIYALDTILDLEPGATKGDLERAMQGHSLAEGQLMGKHQR